MHPTPAWSCWCNDNPLPSGYSQEFQRGPGQADQALVGEQNQALGESSAVHPGWFPDRHGSFPGRTGALAAPYAKHRRPVCRKKGGKLYERSLCVEFTTDAILDKLPTLCKLNLVSSALLYGVRRSWFLPNLKVHQERLMEFLKILPLRGPNIWTYRPVTGSLAGYRHSGRFSFQHHSRFLRTSDCMAADADRAPLRRRRARRFPATAARGHLGRTYSRTCHPRIAESGRHAERFRQGAQHRRARCLQGGGAFAPRTGDPRRLARRSRSGAGRDPRQAVRCGGRG